MSRPRRDTPAAPASQRRMPNGWCGELPNRDGHYRAAAARVRHHHHHGHPRRAPDRSPLPAGAGSPRGLPTTRLPATSRTAAVCGYRPQNHTPACSAPISGAPAAGPSAWSRRLRDRPCHGSSRHRVTRRPAPRRPFISSHLGSCRCRRAGSPIASPRSPRQRGRVVIRRLPRSRERRSTARSRRRPRSRARRRPSLPRSHAADHAAALAGPPRCERPRAAGPRRGGLGSGCATGQSWFPRRRIARSALGLASAGHGHHRNGRRQLLDRSQDRGGGRPLRRDFQPLRQRGGHCRARASPASERLRLSPETPVTGRVARVWAVTSGRCGWFSGWRRADSRRLCRPPGLTGKACVARRRPRTFGVT